MMNRGLTAVFLCAATVTSAAAAEQTPPTVARPIEALALPARVRLNLADGRRLKCDLLGIEDGRLLVRPVGRLPEASWTVPFADLRGAERSLGRRRGRAALIGGLVGAAVGGALVLSGASGVGCNSSECFCSGSGCFTAFTWFGAPAAATGALVGALSAGERWTPLDLGRAGPPSVEARALAARRPPLANGIQAGWTIRF